MYHPTTRVLALLELLQTHRSLGGAEIAERLGVDRRTVRRYIARLEELGIPITTERGPLGGYGLIAGFKLPPMMFTEDEALALSVGLLAARALGLDEASPGVTSAQAKLERVAPEALQRRIRAADETIALGLPRGVKVGVAAALSTLSAAAQGRRRVFLRYRSVKGVESEREFDPYGLAYQRGCWYTVGYCHLRGGQRSFRIDRIALARPLDATFVRPEKFDALAHLEEGVATLPRAHAIEVLLRGDLPKVRRAVFAALGILEPVEGGVLLSSQADDLHWFARELCRLPFSFEIRFPDALRDAVRENAERLIAMVGTT